MSYVLDTNIKVWGNSNAIRLSKELLAAAGFKENEKIEIIAEPEQIIIKKQAKKTLKDMFENYQGFYEPTKEDNAWLNMKAIGAEKW